MQWLSYKNERLNPEISSYFRTHVQVCVFTLSELVNDTREFFPDHENQIDWWSLIVWNIRDNVVINEYLNKKSIVSQKRYAKYVLIDCPVVKRSLNFNTFY